MKRNRPQTNYLAVTMLIMMLQSLTFSTLVGSAAGGVNPTPKTTSTSQSVAYTQPTLNLDFNSLIDRTSAENAMAAARSNWGSFFVERPKPKFS